HFLDQERAFLAPGEPWQAPVTKWEKVRHRLRLAMAALRGPDHLHVMSSREHRMNFAHLLDQVLAFDVPGEVAEIGSYNGQTALSFQSIMQDAGSKKLLHLYDDFRTLRIDPDPLATLKTRFARNERALPVIHQGDIFDTLPAQLPERIAFVHIDCGSGLPNEQHRDLILHALRSVYPRMAPNAVGVLMDYHDPARTLFGADSNPGVKMACDVFFADKPERMSTVFGGYYSQGFFRKR
ncbi:MAG TPA: class I SAM-dependent methyltransferase, partial [Flavobacteriales bacterium]|nr:class I SAM-dependent methyltransferase [Flavobacteriales bacterium]